MRISIICNSYPSRKNPYNQVFIKLIADKLRQSGHNVDICYNMIFDIWGNANQSKSFLANIIKYIVFVFSIIKWIVLVGKNTGIIFSHGILFSTFFSIFLKHLLSKPVVCYVHGGDLNLYYKKYNLMHKIIVYSLNSSDFIIVNSRDIYIKVKRISTNNNITIISPGIDTDVFYTLPNIETLKRKHSIPLGQTIFLCVGNAITRKGFDILLNAIVFIKKMKVSIFNSLFFVILTNGPEKVFYIDFINKNRITSNISIRDKAPHQILNEYYNLADFFIFPSREEPLGLVGLEAMSVGTVVIGANVGGIADYIVDGFNGYLFTPENHRHLADKILFAIRHDTVSTGIHKNMINTVINHDINFSINRINDIFSSIINSKKNDPI